MPLQDDKVPHPGSGSHNGSKTKKLGNSRGKMELFDRRICSEVNWKVFILF